jgi:uracil-DNA glycosylase
VKYYLPDGKILIPSYHPSPRNVNTKVIDTEKMMNLLIMAKKYSKL